jgi:phosphoribosylglycinamide formyltransferase-1
VAVASGDAPALGRGAGHPHRGVRSRGLPRSRRAGWELADWLQERGARLVVLARYMDLSARASGSLPDAVISVHPSLLPRSRVRAIEQALAYGVVFGVTVHFVDAGVDSGPVILQRAIELPDAEDAEQVHAALRPIEHELLPRAVALFARGAVRAAPENPRRTLVDRAAIGTGDG